MTPLAAVMRGVLAGVVGTVCLDTVGYLRYRRGGGKILPEAMIYKPIWEYDVKTLARDLGGHLAYGAGTAAAFWLFAKPR